MQWKLGQGRKESGVSPALAVLHQQFTPHGDWLWMGLIFLWLQRHRGSFKVVSIFPCFPHSSEVMGSPEGPWYTAHHQHNLFPSSKYIQPCLSQPWEPLSTLCSLLISYGMICFALSSRTHTPAEFSCLTRSSPQPHTECPAPVSIRAGHPVCIWQGKCSALRSPWLIVSHLTSIPGQQYSQRSALLLFNLTA